MKKKTYHFAAYISLLCILTCILSCKKSSNDPKSQSDSYSALVDESSGWKRVGMVKNTYSNVDQNANCDMTPYDLSFNNGKIQVLYSEDKYENGDKYPKYFKADCKVGDFGMVTNIDKFPFFAIQPYQLRTRPFFIPGSFNTETLTFSHEPTIVYDEVVLWDENASQITKINPYCDLSYNIKPLANGDLLGGDVNNSNIGELDYYNKATNKWTYINQSSGDTQYLITYVPIKIEDGTLLAFRLYTLGKSSFMSMADFDFKANYPTPFYKTRFKESHPEYNPNGLASNNFTPAYPTEVKVIASNYESGKFAVVLMERDINKSSYTLSSYIWNYGDKSFKKVYSNLPITRELGDYSRNHKLDVGVTMEGTFYSLVNDGNHYYLDLTSSEGEKKYGIVPTYIASANYAPFLRCLRYFNGEYYAVATPFYAGYSYIGQHLDIVKLKP